MSLENGLLQLPNPAKLEDGWVLAPTNLPNTIYEQIYSPNVRYCFVPGLCFPEQKLSKALYNVWVILHKDTGNVINGHCTCTAG